MVHAKLHACRSLGKIGGHFITADNLSLVIKKGNSGLVEWAIEKKISAPQGLSNDEKFKKGIKNAIYWGRWKYLELVYELVPFEIANGYLKSALWRAKLDVLKFLIQKKNNLQELPSDDALTSFMEAEDLFEDVMQKVGRLRIAKPGNKVKS